MKQLLSMFVLTFFSGTLFANAPLMFVDNGQSSSLSAQMIFMDTFSVDPTPESNSPLSSVDTPASISTPYAFPSPAINGETEIGFRVSGSAIDILFSLFDSTGAVVFKTEIEASVGYMRIPISPTTLGFQLPSGVYYFLLANTDSEVLGKGSFAVMSKAITQGDDQ